MVRYGWLVVALGILIVGCGGEGASDPGPTDATTNGTTIAGRDGSTSGDTGGDVSAFYGTYAGSFSGSNTTSAHYTGTGTANVAKDGTANFSFTASASGAPIGATFTGTIDPDGNFAGTRNTGEDADGTVSLDGTKLTAVITWDKLNSNGDVFYKSTERFSLTKK